MEYEGYETILVERRDRVLYLTLNRPEALNAVNGRMHAELARIFLDAGMDDDSEVIVITGAGRAFSAGGDIPWLQSMMEHPHEFQRTGIEGKRIVMSILEARQPVIAKVNGAAVGLGATVALACDVVFAAQGARIGDPHVSVGFAAGDGGTALWPALIGYARAREYLYTGELIPAERAAEIGLINHVVPADRLDEEVETFARRLVNGAIRAIQWTKLAVNSPLRAQASANLDTSLALETLSNMTDDHREGLQAFVERRPPQFRGL
jgi:enoyl-CoA hydratase